MIDPCKTRNRPVSSGPPWYLGTGWVVDDGVVDDGMVDGRW